MVKKAAQKVDTLIEALPYIRRFFGKVVVVKYGGSAVEQDDLNQSILDDITFMSLVGMHPVVVHGAGPHITKRMEAAGVDVKFVNGVRVTNKKTLEIVSEALTVVNREMVRQLTEGGNEAKGFVGYNGELIKATKKNQAIPVGLVGDITGFDTRIVHSLLRSRIIPVVAPLGVGDDGQVYNLNADTVAAELARAMKAEKLVLLTNVNGIMRDVNDPESLLSSVTVGDIAVLKDQKVIQGGMIPKVDACVHAAEGGVPKTHIISAQVPHALLVEIYTDKGIGTEIVPGKKGKA